MSAALKTFKYPVEPFPPPKLKDIVDKEMNEIKDHFQSHGYIYMITTSSILLLIIISIIIRVGIVRCCSQVRRTLFRDIQQGRLDEYLNDANVTTRHQAETQSMIRTPSAPNDSFQLPLHPNLNRSKAI
jgi:hypothetical protein